MLLRFALVDYFEPNIDFAFTGLVLVHCHLGSDVHYLPDHGGICMTEMLIDCTGLVAEVLSLGKIYDVLLFYIKPS